MTGASMRRFDLRVALVGWLLCLLAGPASAHKSSDAYLFFTPTAAGTALRWDIALRDLDAVLPSLDANGDRSITYGEFKAATADIDAYALSHLAIQGCRFAVRDHALERRADGTYAVLKLEASCAVTASTDIGYALFADVDPTHRGIVKIARNDGQVDLKMLDPGARHAASADANRPTPPSSFLQEGVHHIVTGYDHVLFLLCLLLPAVLRRNGRSWEPVDTPRQAVVPVLTIVSLFTLAHSITLGLAAAKLVSLPPWFIEPSIAATIVVAAVDNLRPVFGRWRGLVTFLFGLIHGFGFAGVLSELDLPTAEFGWALLKFNVGLELGQIAIVALVMPLLFAGRRSAAYPRWVLHGGSIVAIALALWWFAQRTVLAWV